MRKAPPIALPISFATARHSIGLPMFQNIRQFYRFLDFPASLVDCFIALASAAPNAL